METATETGAMTAPAAPPRGHSSLDLADLVSLLLSSERPDRDNDLLVHVMLGGPEPLQRADRARIRASFWLRDGTPAYTGGREALSALAHRRGYRLEYRKDGDQWHVEARDPASGDRIGVKHALPGIAGIVGIASLVARRTA